MRNRIAGLEIEYGCLTTADLDVHEVIRRVCEWVFEQSRYGLLDIHHRDWDEPPGNGGFLFNGGRVYIDMGHIEYCTPECPTLRDLVSYDAAGDQLLTLALQDLDLADKVSFVRNNVDHYTGATFGCHENYLISRTSPLNEKNVFSLLAFLTLRTVFTGAGRVGSVQTYRMRRSPLENPEVDCFQMTQRADYIQNDFFEWVQGNRAIINTRDEPLADPSKYRRLHLLHGDTNVLPGTLYLKVGTTRLVLDLLDANAMPKVRLQDGVESLRRISYDPDGPWRVTQANGSDADVLELLAMFLDACSKEFAGRDDETDDLLRWWEFVMQALGSGDLDQLIGIVDWVTKKHLLDAFCEAEGLSYSDSWVAAQDLEYHNIDHNRSLGMALAVHDPAWATKPLSESLVEPPQGSRAAKRSALMRQINEEDYLIDWDEVKGGGVFEELLDPYGR